jgi:hypothetical protein
VIVNQYSKKAQYVLPAWSLGVTYLDGIYFDGNLFNNNIPITGGVIHILVTPVVQATPIAVQQVDIGFPTFVNGKVVRAGHKFNWAPFTYNPLLWDFLYNGHPYGIGLNTIAVQLLATPPNPQDILYKVIYAFSMEVG